MVEGFIVITPLLLANAASGLFETCCDVSCLYKKIVRALDESSNLIRGEIAAPREKVLSLFR
jgi:hypothetical protein